MPGDSLWWAGRPRTVPAPPQDASGALILVRCPAAPPRAVGAGSIALWGVEGSKALQLPITKGPQTSGESGKGGSLRSKL
jgi:hypothetical protein